MSLDGKSYTEVANKSYDEMDEPGPKVLKNLLVPFKTTEAQFIRVEILSQLTNPQWHPAPGAPSWLFIDEIALD